MAKSAEYPDLNFVPPRWWSDEVRRPKWIVIHTTEGAKSGLAAEDGAAYNARRADQTSCHYHADNNSVVQSVPTKNIAFCAFPTGNQWGIQYELCTQGDSANWNDAYHSAMLVRAARQIARDCTKWGISLRHLTVAQLRGKSLTGFCGHVDISAAFEGNHHDPGPNFPWTRFLALVRDAQEDMDMPSLDEIEDRLVPAIMTRLGAELKLATGEVYKGAVDTSRDGLRAMLWDVAHANRQDAAYLAAPDAGPGGKVEMRNTRDLLEEIIKGCVREVLQEGTGGTPPTS